MQYQTIVRNVISILFLLAAPISYAGDQSRIAVIGDLDSINIGQDGYCGERMSIERKSWQSIFVKGGDPVWFQVKATMRLPTHTRTCTGEYSFVPDTEKAYILRYSFLGDKCMVELFKVVPGGDPVKQRLSVEEPRSCLVK